MSKTKKMYGFTIGERVHFGGVCTPDTWGKVVRFDKELRAVYVETDNTYVLVHPEDLFHDGEKA